MELHRRKYMKYNIQKDKKTKRQKGKKAKKASLNETLLLFWWLFGWQSF